MSLNNRNLLWRVVASSTHSVCGRDEVFAFVDAVDRETDRELMFQRLSIEWGIDRDFIEFDNLEHQLELRKQAIGNLITAGAALLETGWDDGKPRYELDPLILVASPSLRAVLDEARKEIEALSVNSPGEETCSSFLSRPISTDHN